MYAEDVDFCLRVGDSGWGVAILPGEHAKHSVGASSSHVTMCGLSGLRIFSTSTSYALQRVGLDLAFGLGRWPRGTPCAAQCLRQEGKDAAAARFKAYAKAACP